MLSLEDINTGSRSSRLGVRRKADEHALHKSENWIQSGSIFEGRLWLKKGYFANDLESIFNEVVQAQFHTFITEFLG